MGTPVLLRRAHVLAPEDLGVRDLLIAGEQIVAIDDRLDVGDLDVEQVDAEGRYVVPGLVDGHLHIVGGGGNEGYASRIPELWAGELLAAGITTVVAPPGLDTVTKNLEGLLAKAYALESEGVTARVMVGGFQRPFLNLTGSLRRDIFLLEKVIGVKIALGEVRASRYRDHELIELAAQLHWLAGATGKACLMHAHLGSTEDPAGQLVRTMASAGVPPEKFQATHCNYTPDTMAAVRAVSDLGGYVDFNPVLTPAFGHPSAVPAAEAVASCLSDGVNPKLITMTSDGNASVPILRPDGSRGSYEKSLDWLWGSVVELVRDFDVPLSRAVQFVTSNPARVLGLPQKGRVEVGADADLLVLSEDLTIEHVLARGARVVTNGRPQGMSMYEPERPAAPAA